MKPNYIIIGAGKSGTTTLAAMLGKHPEVYMFPPKEIHFFNWNFSKGYEWYESLFKPSEKEKAIGEASPGYTSVPSSAQAAQRIAEYLPDARLIFIVRHPVKRLESNYVQSVSDGVIKDDFSKAIYSTPLVQNSQYFARINEYRQYFDDKKILVLFFEDFIANHSTTLTRCFEFLEVDPSWQMEESLMALNTRSDKRIDTDLMKWLRQQPSYQRLNWLMPRSVINLLKPLFRSKLSVDIKWEDGVYEYVVQQLKPDIEAFLKFYGKSPDFWTF